MTDPYDDYPEPRGTALLLARIKPRRRSRTTVVLVNSEKNGARLTHDATTI
jgi:hypothetical protein